MEKTQSKTKLIGKFEPLEFILLFLIILLFLSFISLAAIDIKTSLPYSISEFIDYSKILENNMSIHACIKKESGECIGNINITNKQQLTQYINYRHRTDVMRDIEDFKQSYEKYKWLYSYNCKSVDAYLYLNERKE